MKLFNRVIFPLLVVFFRPNSSLAQCQPDVLQNTVKIQTSDTPEIIIQKAAHIVPTPNQHEAQKNEFICIAHFGPNTFTCKEWGSGLENPEMFGLEELDTDQWCAAIKEAGAKEVILTVKHHDGFCLWQTRYTKHGIMSSKFKDGKGDVFKELAKSCQKYGLKLGFYLSPADLYQMESAHGLYGNGSKSYKRSIPREVPGRPFKNKTRFEFVVDDYNEYFLNQLFELLTEYGPIHEVRFDGAHPKRKGGQKYNYAAWKKLIRTLAPQAVIFGREDVRWCGTESGKTRQTEWNVIPFTFNPDTASHFPDLTAKDLGSRQMLYKGNYLHYQQAVTNTSIREGWFFRDDIHQGVRNADDVFDIYERAVGGNSTFMLNIPPNRKGKISSRDVSVLHEIGQRIRRTYNTNLLKGAEGPNALLDNDEKTFIKVKNPIIIKTEEPISFNRILLQESVTNNSERIEDHAVDAWLDGDWVQIASATNVGYKRILRFPTVKTDRIRIRVGKSRLTPTLCTVSAHFYQSRPPQLECARSQEGIVTIRPLKHKFDWKPHGEDASANINKGYKIHYTLDGSEPTEKSMCYTKPFKMDNGILKAVAILNSEKGAVMQRQMGYIKKSWKLLQTSGDSEDTKAQYAFDEDESTYWLDESEQQHFMGIDLGEVKRIEGFIYTPQTKHDKGMIQKGKLCVSRDGKTWQTIDSFDFGNLINDPSRRTHYLKNAADARFVRIEATEIAAQSASASAAEIDFF